MSGELRPDHDYQAYLDQGRFRLLRARDTGQIFFYPRIAAPGTGSRELEWIDADGRGTVYSFTVVSQKPPLEPYNVVLVDLVEGPRLMSRVAEVALETISIGMRVRCRVDQIEGKGLLVFVPDTAAP